MLMFTPESFIMIDFFPPLPKLAGCTSLPIRLVLRYKVKDLQEACFWKWDFWRRLQTMGQNDDYLYL